MLRFLATALLILTALPAAAQSALPEYILVETVRKSYLSFPPKCNSQINWTKPVLTGNLEPDLEKEGQIDGRALIEGSGPVENRIMSLIEWTKPLHDMRIDRLVMHLAAQDMGRGTTFRVRPRIEALRRPDSETTSYGQDYNVYTSYMRYLAGGGVVTGIGGLISTVANQDFYEFHIRVQISDGGECFEEPVIYKFRQLEDGGITGSNRDQGEELTLRSIVLQSSFEDFGSALSPWGTNVLYGENGIWWTSGNARAVAKVIEIPKSDGKTGLFIKNESARGPNVYGTTARRVSLIPGRRYTIRFLGAARNLGSNGGVNIAVDPQWRIRPIAMPAGTYNFRAFEGSFIATDAFVDIRIISEDGGQVVITDFIVALADD